MRDEIGKFFALIRLYTDGKLTPSSLRCGGGRLRFSGGGPLEGIHSANNINEDMVDCEGHSFLYISIRTMQRVM